LFQIFFLSPQLPQTRKENGIFLRIKITFAADKFFSL
jgi:hypothetical protein